METAQQETARPVNGDAPNPAVQPSRVAKAYEVLQRIVQPFSDLNARASGEWWKVEVEESLNNPQKAAAVAWGLVRRFSQEAAPKYLGQARARLGTLKQDSFFAEVCAELEVRLEVAEQAKTKGDFEAVIRISRQVYGSAQQATRTPAAERYFADKAKRRRQGGKVAASGGPSGKPTPRR